MSRIFLIFSAALVAMMAGALFYVARIPVQKDRPAEQQAPPPAEQAAEQPATLEIVSHPSFELPDIDNNMRQLSDWDGKKRILNFWATWCAPCRREIPLLKAFQEQQAENGFQVIGIAVDFPEDVSRYAEAAEFNYPVVVGQQEAMALAESSGLQFSVLPFTMFVAADGEFLSAYIGELHEEHLDTIVYVMTRLEAQVDSRTRQTQTGS